MAGLMGRAGCSRSSGHCTVLHFIVQVAGVSEGTGLETYSETVWEHERSWGSQRQSPHSDSCPVSLVIAISATANVAAGLSTYHQCLLSIGSPSVLKRKYSYHPHTHLTAEETEIQRTCSELTQTSGGGASMTCSLCES